MIRVLLIEDSEGDVELVRRFLRDARSDPYALAVVDTLAEGIAALRDESTDVVFLDLNLADSNGLETIDAVRSAFPEIPIVVLTGMDDLETAVLALRRGADDYLPKGDLSTDLLTRTIRYSVERRRMVGALEQERRTAAALYDEARAATQARENVLQVVSHDLRNHVNTMQMALHLLRPSVLPEAIRRLEVVERASGTMRRLLDDMIDVAAIDKGVLTVDPAIVDLHALLEDARVQLGPSVEQKGIALEWRPSTTGLTAWADRARVDQVLGNLVSNAAKYTPTGGRISVACEAMEREILIAVADTGAGIPPAERERIFDRFYRGTRPLGQGAGLGLAISRALVEAHGGRIWVESEVNVGTTFRFTLPRSAPEGTAAASALP